MSSCLLKSLCLPTLRYSGAKYVGYKLIPGWFQNFSVCLRNTLTKKLLKTQQKPLCIMSAMALAYLNILPRALIWFFNNSWDYWFYRRTHYPILEKVGIKNLAVCENQGKSDEKKQGGGDTKKTKGWLINRFQQKILHKKKKVMQLVKPVNYLGIPTNAQSS